MQMLLNQPDRNCSGRAFSCSSSMLYPFFHRSLRTHESPAVEKTVQSIFSVIPPWSQETSPKATSAVTGHAGCKLNTYPDARLQLLKPGHHYMEHAYVL